MITTEAGKNGRFVFLYRETYLHWGLFIKLPGFTGAT